MAALREKSALNAEDIDPNVPNIVGDGAVANARRKASWLIHTFIFEQTMTAIIVLNLVLVILQADYKAFDYKAGEAIARWSDSVGPIPLAIYSCELSLKLFVWGGRYFGDHERIFDFTIVFIDLASTVLTFAIGDLPSASVLRILRLMKLVRTVRVLTGFHELYMIISGLSAAMRALWWGCLLLFFMLIIFSVLAVEILLPYSEQVYHNGGFGDCERCSHAFDSVFGSLFTFVQLSLLGTGWDEVFMPIIDHQPWTAILLMFILVTVTLGVLNLILSAIIDNAAHARDRDNQIKALDKAKAYKAVCNTFKGICQQLDNKGTGTLTYKEYEDAFEYNGGFYEVMEFMNLEHDDLMSMLRMLDHSNAGSVSITEVAEEMYTMKTEDKESLLVQIRCHLADAREERRKVSIQLNAVSSSMNAASKERDIGSIERKAVLRNIDNFRLSLLDSPAEKEAAVNERKLIMQEILSLREGMGLAAPCAAAVQMLKAKPKALTKWPSIKAPLVPTPDANPDFQSIPKSQLSAKNDSMEAPLGISTDILKDLKSMGDSEGKLMTNIRQALRDELGSIRQNEAGHQQSVSTIPEGQLTGRTLDSKGLYNDMPQGFDVHSRATTPMDSDTLSGTMSVGLGKPALSRKASKMI